MREVVYDLETYPNYFCAGVEFLDVDGTGAGLYEVSDRRNDIAALVDFVLSLHRMYGFNNEAFDYPILHYLIFAYRQREFDGWAGGQIAYRLYELCKHIIEGQERIRVWESDRLVPQVDVFKIHHFDNRARSTSLKSLQFAMRSRSIEDLPFPPGTYLTPEQMETTGRYCIHDVSETKRFIGLSREAIEFREELDRTMPGRESWMNLSDTSIGKRFFRERLEQRRPGITKGRTPRAEIQLAPLIQPWIQFQEEPFQRKLRELQSMSVHASNLKQAHKGTVVNRGFRFDFGNGGLHGSVSRRVFHANDEQEVLDVDVKSFYPRMSVMNQIAPLHLGADFCVVYDELFHERDQFASGTSQNKIYKLALNGVFGDTNNVYSKGFFDPACTLAITINGQLELCMFAEAIMRIEGVEVLQVNTDGVTIRFPRRVRHLVDEVSAWWQWGTGLTLETVAYRSMFVRDVNNYVAQPVDARKSIKRKGAYEYECEWWQDPSMLAVARAAEAQLLEGIPARDFLENRLQVDPWDFMIRAKVPRTNRLYWGNMEVQRVSRYYVAREGWELTKVMPPLHEGGNERVSKMQKGSLVQIRNVYEGEPLGDVNLDWYENEVKKLTRFKG